MKLNNCLSGFKGLLLKNRNLIKKDLRFSLILFWKPKNKHFTDKIKVLSCCIQRPSDECNSYSSVFIMKSHLISLSSTKGSQFSSCMVMHHVEKESKYHWLLVQFIHCLHSFYLNKGLKMGPSDPGGSGSHDKTLKVVVSDGLNLAADLLWGEPVQPPLPDHHKDCEDCCQSQHGCLKLPEEVFFHHSRATAKPIRERLIQPIREGDKFLKYCLFPTFSKQQTNIPGSESFSLNAPKYSELGSWIETKISSMLV